MIHQLFGADINEIDHYTRTGEYNLLLVAVQIYSLKKLLIDPCLSCLGTDRGSAKIKISLDQYK